jgi:hypothetical protein
MTKSKFAFQCNLDTLFHSKIYGYLWTFTFADLPDIGEAAERWRLLMNWLVRTAQACGVRVYELHETHGVHIHAILDRYLHVRQIRPVAQHFGFGRIHVKKVDREGANYLAKYLTKQGRTAWLKHKRLWTAFGPFRHTRIKDIEVESNFTRAIKFCQQELHCSKLPFGFVQVLQQWPTADPVKLKLACSMLKSGPYYVDIARVLRE